MSAADLSFALQGLAAWSRRHGIHQARAVLGFAAKEAAASSASDALAQRLEDRARDVSLHPHSAAAQAEIEVVLDESAAEPPREASPGPSEKPVLKSRAEERDSKTFSP
jgi:hypothetical protein